MSAYYLLTLANSTPDSPAPWPIVVDQDGTIIMGRPDADGIHEFEDLLTGESPVFVLRETELLVSDMFTVDGLTLVNVREYLPEFNDERMARTITKLRATEARYRKALGR